MDASSVNPQLLEQVKKLQEKYAAMGQDLSSYLDGLLHADYLTYWDYIHLDTLLTLQNPRTSFPDEKIFIIYHQITELYFRLVLLELEQLTSMKHPSVDFFAERLDRIIRYFGHLENSFDIMVQGMEKEQFLKFRMSLLPSSGFQSAQYRMIEFICTDLINLIAQKDQHELITLQDPEKRMEKLYWRSGATELATGKKTLTLRQFEAKYMDQFIRTVQLYKDTNLYQLYKRYYLGEEKITERLRKLDTLINVLWPLAHMKSASHYLEKDPEDIKATGGTNWQKYLPPRFQRIIFFPDLWSEEEKQEWGKAAFIRNR